MKLALVLALSIALSACDGVLRIKGEAPLSQTRIVKLFDEASGQVANSFSVSGPFEERVFFPGHWRAPEVAITAECGGRVLLTVLHPDFPEVNLGKLQP